MELRKIKGETLRQKHGKRQLGIVVKLYTSLSTADNVTNKARPESAYPISWWQFEPHMKCCSPYFNAL
jgi:hypothetical protein